MPVIVLHGGASKVPGDKLGLTLVGLKRAVRAGFDVLKNHSSAVEAVEAAVATLENDPVFNAGYGSSLTSKGTVEMDAMLVDGSTMKFGSVAAVTRVWNPISLARAVMEKSEHCMLVGDGANSFAREMRMLLFDNEDLIHDYARQRLEECQSFNNAINEMKSDHDTVGAVAIDEFGQMASATSTGGITGQRAGRIGDTPIIGAGGWADNRTCALSATGHGEAIMRVCLTQYINSMYKYKGMSIQEAVEAGIRYMQQEVDGCGGIIGVDNKQEIGIYFNTPHMPWIYMNNDDMLHYGTHPNEHLTCLLA